MYFHVFCNQKTISPHHLAAVKEFQKRLSAYCITSLSAEPIPSFPKQVRAANSHALILTSGPSSDSSETFAEKIRELQHSGRSHICVYIGYPEEPLYKNLQDYLVSARTRTFSLTACSLTPETLTLLFFEQLYRGHTILQGKAYHK